MTVQHHSNGAPEKRVGSGPAQARARRPIWVTFARSQRERRPLVATTQTLVGFFLSVWYLPTTEAFLLASVSTPSIYLQNAGGGITKD